MGPILPTRDNTAVLFLDLQERIAPHSRTVPADALARSAGTLAKVAALHKLPAFLSAVPPGGAFFETVTGPLGGAEPRMRTGTSAFADASLAEALASIEQRVLILAGVASEIVVQRTALDALASGFTVHVAVDACGGIGPRTEEAAWRRILAAGGVTSSVTTFAAELTGDFTTELGQKTLALVYETMG